MATVVKPRPEPIVWAAAVGAVLTRIPALATPPKPDESGFTLVARSWHPQSHSVYGFFWVDRPPELIALVKLTDAIGGFYALRVLGALCCAAFVLLCARAAREVAVRLDADAASLARWAAVLALAAVGSTYIDPVTKGEVLALPLTALSVLAALTFVRRPTAPWWLPFVSGLSASAAMGLKQDLVDGAVFASVLFLMTLQRDRLRALPILVLGALVPVVATVLWAVAAGVDLGTLAYEVAGFRSDATRVIAAHGTSPDGSLGLLARTWLSTFLFVVPLVHAVCLRALWRRDRALAGAVTALLVWEYAAMLLSGGGWPAYLFGIAPGSVLALACAVALAPPARQLARGAAALIMASCLVSLVAWTASAVTGSDAPVPAVYVADAIRHSSRPGDTVVAYGSRADLVLGSGLRTPYPFLWTLPMRVFDPRLADLRALLSGPRAPTWFVVSVPLDSWGITQGAQVQAILDQRYRAMGDVCGWPVYALASVDRPRLEPGDCSRPWWIGS